MTSRYSIVWTETFEEDVLERIAFLYRQTNDYPGAVSLFSEMIADIRGKLEHFPNLGNRLEQFEARNVRRLLISRYEVRYEITGQEIVVLNIFHTLEERD
jgi:plasmid stabilization system protein ParE